MNLLAIVGSPRKRKATDTLIGKAIEGSTSKALDCLGSMYAGDIEHRGVVYYFEGAYQLGKKLVSVS